MKFFKIKLFVVLFICLSIYAYAQEQQHFIQVSVTDTVTLKPLRFIYKISKSVTTSYNKKDTVSEKMTISELNDRLGKENFADRVLFDNYSISSYENSGEYLLVTVNSISELKRLSGIIENFKGFDGKISNIEYESPEQYTDMLFERMYDEAKKQASIMAEKTGNELGKVINVSEVKGQWEGLLDWYSQLEKEMPAEFLKSNPELERSYSRNFQFTFELK